MSTSVRGNLTWVWLLLLVITAGSWAMGTHWLGPKEGGVLALAAVLALSLVKMRLVILHFMEVQHAPAAIRYLCGAWLIVLFAALLWIYS